MTKSAAEAIRNELLKTARIRKNWSQQDLAERLTPRPEKKQQKLKGADEPIEVVDETTISRWERGATENPLTYYQNQLAALLERTPKQLGFSIKGEKGQIPFWDIAERKENPIFTGREDILAQLAAVLMLRDLYNRNSGDDDPPMIHKPQVLSGLGGCGKSQIVVEYAYRYKHDYHTIILLNAADPVLLKSEFAKIARTLDLSEQLAEDQNKIIEAVRAWFAQPTLTRWLLIFDNVDTEESLQVVRELIPLELYGHVILTSRTPATDTLMQPIMIESMQPEEGATFLLRRAHRITDKARLNDAPEHDRLGSVTISKILGGLPLAIDQAAAYILKRKVSLQKYKKLYETTRAKILAYRGSWEEYNYPDSIATTWLLNFEQVGLVARELLSFFAFLAPDAIPEEIVTKCASLLGPDLGPVVSDSDQLSSVVENMLNYSLITRDSEAEVFSIHRLVQAVVQDEMSKQKQHEWASRAVRAVNKCFPSTDVRTRPLDQRYLTHARICANFIEQERLMFPDAAYLLNGLGIYLVRHAEYSEAEQVLQQCLALTEQILGPEDPYKELVMALILQNLGVCYHKSGKYEQAEATLQQSLEAIERAPGSNDPTISKVLDDLAALYLSQGKFEQAVPLLQRSLAISEEEQEPEHVQKAISLQNLGVLYSRQGKYEQAEAILLQSLAAIERALGSESYYTGGCSNSLALLYVRQGKFEQAEPYYLKALPILEKELGPEHPDVIIILGNLATLYYRQKKFEQAIPLVLQSLKIRTSKLGLEHLETLNTLNTLAALYWENGQLEDAELLLQHILEVYNRVWGPENYYTGQGLNNLAMLYWKQSKFEQAITLLLRALPILEKELGPEHPETEIIRHNIALLRKKRA